MFRFCAMMLLVSVTATAWSQENSPYSRYGLGDLYPKQHIASRAMGGISAAFLDGQALNTANPASYGSIRFVTYDLGISVDSRKLKSASGEMESENSTAPNGLLKGLKATASEILKCSAARIFSFFGSLTV